MVISNWLRSVLRLPRVSGGVRALPQSSPSRSNWRQIARHKAAQAVALLSLSAMLAFWAHRLTLAEAILAWKRDHPPDCGIWSHALQSRGYRQVEDILKIHRALRTLPLTLDHEGSAWISDNRAWIALFCGNSEDGSPEVFAAKARLPKPPDGWTPAGSSWDGLEEILRLTETRPLPPPPRGNQPGNQIDPRSIQY